MRARVEACYFGENMKNVFGSETPKSCIFYHPRVRNAENDRSRGLGHKKGPQKRVPEQILGL